MVQYIEPMEIARSSNITCINSRNTMITYLTSHCCTNFSPVLDEPVVVAVLSAVAHSQHTMVQAARAAVRLIVNARFVGPGNEGGT